MTLISNFNSKLEVWSRLSSVSFLLFDNKSLVGIKRSVGIGKRGSFFGSYIVIPSTRIE